MNYYCLPQSAGGVAARITNTYAACIDCGRGRWWGRAVERARGRSQAQINFWCALNKPPLPDYLGHRLHCCQSRRRHILNYYFTFYFFNFLKVASFYFACRARAAREFISSSAGEWIFMACKFIGQTLFLSHVIKLCPMHSGQPLKSFRPNCLCQVLVPAGLHLKPDKSHVSTAICNTYANNSNRFSLFLSSFMFFRLRACVCVLIRNFSSTSTKCLRVGWAGWRMLLGLLSPACKHL